MFKKVQGSYLTSLVKIGSVTAEIRTIPVGVGWGVGNSGYNALSVQLKLHLPNGTELGKRLLSANPKFRNDA